MKMTGESSKDSAMSNALSALKKDKRFPNNVFLEKWNDYLFFESDMVFDRGFIEAKDLLLREERASVIALINLRDDTDSNPSVMFLEQSTGWGEYCSKLKGDGSALNWLFLMDRYVCASDGGNWAIYCEKENDVAVFAFRESLSESACAQVATILQARPINMASNSERGEYFQFGKLVPYWRSTLVSEYVPSHAP